MTYLNDGSLLKNKAFVNGQWIKANDNSTFEVKNPFNQSLISSVPNLGAVETKNAILQASKAFNSWSKKTATERSVILHHWYELQMENLEDLATLLTLEMGKPIVEARAEIKYGASFVKWFAEEAQRVYGDVIPGQSQDKRIVVIKQPIGVIAAITPWNFPNAMITRKIAPALAAGCTAVVKPAEDTPLSALALAELAHRAGFPDGVFNVLTTNAPKIVGQELTQNPTVRKLSFTGSTKVGKMLMSQCASTVKKISLELGGNAPFIVFEDADIDEAVKGAMASKYRNAGQTCVCANRLFVQDSVYDEFIQKFSESVQQHKIGSGLSEDTTIGPLINQAALEKVEFLVSDAIQKGAKAVIGGEKHPLGGHFFQPTILANANADMQIFKEEIFGPIAPVYRFSTEEEVIQMANDTPYGLAAYFYGRDIGRVWSVAEALEYGMVGINTGLMSSVLAPFGGIKESGIGREGSKYGIEEFVELKYLCFGGIK